MSDSETNVCIGLGANEYITTETGSIVIGNGAFASGNSCFVIGDDAQVSGDNQVCAGTSLFGREMPLEVRDLILSQTRPLKWLLRELLTELHKYQLERRDK